jgi:nucleotide-binding universal stress UspA family protein
MDTAHVSKNLGRISLNEYLLNLPTPPIMKTILAPTDFSDSSRNAVLYALAIAKKVKASLILYNAYHIPVSVNEMPVMAFAPDELEKVSLQHVQDYCDQLLDGCNAEEVQVRCLSTPGFAVDEIAELAEEQQTDLIIMGISGAGNLGHILLGSVTTGVLKHSLRPLIIVPDKTVFTSYKRIAFAYDGELELAPRIISQLKTFVEIFAAELLVVIVEKDAAAANSSQSRHIENLQNQFAGIRHSLYFSENEDVSEGIEAFNKEHQIDLVVMIPRQHSFFERIFTQSNTSKMAYHTHIPILALHE